MAKPAVFYVLTAAGFLLFLPFSGTPPATPRRRPGRRLAHIHHLAFDPLIDQLDRRRTNDSLLLDHQTFQEKLDEFSAHPDGKKTSDDIGAMGEYNGEEGPMNVTERLMYLFPLLDRMPKDGMISFEELEAWNRRRASERLVYSTERRMKLHDNDDDGSVTLRQFLSYLSDEELDWNNMEHNKAGWWKEQFVNADTDGNGSLNETELIDFLHPEDSKDPKIQMWLQKKKLGEMDANNDGKLSFTEFRDRSYDIYKNYPAFDTDDDYNPQHHAAEAEKKFAELDVNKDKYLTVEELKPIIHHLHPGEFSYATYFTKYLMHEADDNKDGKLTLKEMLDHHHAFYSTVVEEGRHNDDDDDDYDYDIHDELR